MAKMKKKEWKTEKPERDYTCRKRLLDRIMKAELKKLGFRKNE